MALNLLNMFGLRKDGTKKGMGYFGELPSKGGISTELSIGIELDGKETEIPLLNPSLDLIEIVHLLEGNKPTKSIINKSVNFAKNRIKSGLSPFASGKERLPLPVSGLQGLLRGRQ